MAGCGDDAGGGQKSRGEDDGKRYSSASFEHAHGVGSFGWYHHATFAPVWKGSIFSLRRQKIYEHSTNC